MSVHHFPARPRRGVRGGSRFAGLSVFLLFSLLRAGEPQWQSYTNINYVNDMQAVDSLLVLATNGGIARFRPGELRLERTFVNTDGLPVNNCLVAASDSAGNHWIGTEGGGLAVIPKDSARALVYRPNDLPERITSLAWDRDRLLLGTDRGLYVIESRGTPLDFSDDVIRRYSVASQRELLSDRVLALAVRDGYWVGTNQGVTAVDRTFTNWVGYRRPLGDSVKAIAFWRDSLVVATERGLAVRESTGFRPAFTFSRPRRVSAVAASDTDFYVATDTGVFRGDGMNQNRFQLILQADAQALWLSETLWVGMGGNEQSGHGLAYLATGQSWAYLSLPGIASGQISSCAFNPVTGRLHACHYYTIWGFRVVTEVTTDGRAETRWATLINPIQVSCDSKGRVWYGHFADDGGLSVYDPGADTWGKVQWGPSSRWNVIDALGIDRLDTKWVFNGDGVVVAVDSAGRQADFDVPGLVPPPRGGFDFAFDSRGRAWLGLTVGLVMIDTRGTLHDDADDVYDIITTTRGLPSSEVRSVAVDAEDNVWVATPGGAAAWDGSSVRVYTTGNSGILDNNVYRVRADRSGRIWLLCQSGLSMFDRVSGRWTNYTAQNSGLIKSAEGITDFYTALEVGSDQGLVAVGTQRGLSILRLQTEPDTMPGAHVSVFPNPCVLGVNEWVVISGLPERAAVEIRTLQGIPVARLQVDQGMRRAVWRPGNAASGIYLIRVSGPGGFRVERVAVVGR